MRKTPPINNRIDTLEAPNDSAVDMSLFMPPINAKKIRKIPNAIFEPLYFMRFITKSIKNKNFLSQTEESFYAFSKSMKGNLERTWLWSVASLIANIIKLPFFKNKSIHSLST